MIPHFNFIMRPMLEALSDGAIRDTVWLRDEIAKRFDVTPEERAELLPSGTGKLFANRVAWAYVHLQHAGAIERVARANYRITPRGTKLLAENPDLIDVKVLSQFPELVAFRKGSKGKKKKAEVATAAADLDEDKSPTERLADAHADHRAELTTVLLDRIMKCDPTFFEQLVLGVLVAMGYGGSEEEASEHLGQSGDGGVDGVINEDRLGLDQVYVQAKRRTGSGVGRPEVQGFVGALAGRGAKKGVFITSSHFSPDAQTYVAKEVKDFKVVLIDGEKLADLMLRFGVGVSTRETFAVQEIDEDFFIEELG
jgi:restriction system protein